jgi:predicted  nucleic acid-binding Zn-ribbon protein
MSAEFWAIIGVGVALAGMQWRMYASLNGRMDRIEACMDRIEARMDRIEARIEGIEAALTSVKERLSRIEGWIAGRFREETAPSA